MLGAYKVYFRSQRLESRNRNHKAESRKAQTTSTEETVINTEMSPVVPSHPVLASRYLEILALECSLLARMLDPMGSNLSQPWSATACMQHVALNMV